MQLNLPSQVINFCNIKSLFLHLLLIAEMGIPFLKTETSIPGFDPSFTMILKFCSLGYEWLSYCKINIPNFCLYAIKRLSKWFCNLLMKPIKFLDKFEPSSFLQNLFELWVSFHVLVSMNSILFFTFEAILLRLFSGKKGRFISSFSRKFISKWIW